jgi:outer membrane protein TolC
MKKVLIYIITCTLVASAYTQYNMDSLLLQIGKNNAALNTNRSYWAAQKEQYLTGLTPYDPQVEYDYLFGSPVGAGNQKDFVITQRLDFPTVYNRKSRLAREQRNKADYQHAAYRQDVLLEAKLTGLELVYYNKKRSILMDRQKRTALLLEGFEKKLANGEAIILDINKARLQMLNIQNDFALNDNEIQKLTTRLSGLNGGLPIVFSDTIYLLEESVPDFESLDSLIESNDPIIKVYDAEKLIMERQLAVQKALNLPKLETGYHSQGILGQNYRGVHAGITIPLWENKNRLKVAKLNVAYATENINTQRLAHRMENREMYDQLAVRKKAMTDYGNLFATLNNQYLLNRALELGQITIIQYFQEESYYYDAMDKLFQLELAYHKALANLYKFKL